MSGGRTGWVFVTMFMLYRYRIMTKIPMEVSLSDAYYGDASSVAELYKKTGKPVMVQDVGVLE